jgi:hypothetical protein
MSPDKKITNKENNPARYYNCLRVGGIGLEPTAFAMSTRCSNQLSYPPARLPLYHSRKISQAKAITGDKQAVGCMTKLSSQNGCDKIDQLILP